MENTVLNMPTRAGICGMLPLLKLSKWNERTSSVGIHEKILQTMGKAGKIFETEVYLVRKCRRWSKLRRKYQKMGLE